MSKTAIIFLAVYGLICFAAGFAVKSMFGKSAEPVIVKKEIKESYAVGIPDTASKPTIQKAKLKIKKVDGGYDVKSDNKNLSVTDFNIYPPIDHGEVDLEANVVEKYITRTDTVHVRETIIVDKDEDKEGVWSLAFGSKHVFVKEFEPIKYAMLQYQHKVWFFFVVGSMGIQNRFNESLNNLQIAANVELRAPLN